MLELMQERLKKDNWKKQDNVLDGFIEYYHIE